VAKVAHQPLGAAANPARLFLEVAARAIEKGRRCEMFFKRDGAHGLGAPQSPNVTGKAMLEVNGGDFRSASALWSQRGPSAPASRLPACRSTAAAIAASVRTWRCLTSRAPRTPGPAP